MNEKRFIVFPNNVVWDNQLGEVVCRCILEGIGDAENVCQRLNEQQDTIITLKRRLDYETRMHKKWKDDCLAILEEQDLNDYVKELQKSKKSGWDSEPNTDYVTRAKEGLK